MYLRRLARAFLPLSFMFGVTPAVCGVSACTAEQREEAATQDEEIVDFLADWADEYAVTGTSTVTIEPELASASAAAKKKRAKELVDLKNIQIGWFLNSYLVDKSDDAENVSYGGFSAMTRFGSYESDNLESVSGDARTFKFAFSVQVGGSKRLLDLLPGKKVDGKKKISLRMGKLDNADLARLDQNREWYRSEPWATFNPDELSPEQLETIDLTIARAPQSSDAYLAYDRLFEDGELTVAVHFGWDKETRTDISSSRALYESLVADGYASPAKSYEAYAPTAGPLTKTITANRRPVNVKLWIFHPAGAGVPGPNPDTDQGGKELERDLVESLATREVIVFKGHSGPMYGFALANWHMTQEGDLDDSEIPKLTMPSTYQVVFANGCETYGLGEAFFQIPSKADRASLNVITTTSFANLGTDSAGDALIAALTNQKNGRLTPSRISALTGAMDNGQGWGFNAMFGVHGVNANPKYDPFADRSKLCQPCKASDRAGDGDRCTKLPNGERFWTYDCVDDTGCPSSYACKPVTSTTKAAGPASKRCVPTSKKCG